MSYRLNAIYTDKQYADFIVLHQGLTLENGSDTYTTDEGLTFKGEFIFALEPNEIMSDVEVEIDVPDVDEDGNIIYIEIEKEITVIDYDEDGNSIGEHTEIIKIKIPQTHKETVTVHKPVIDPDYEEKQKQKEKERIAKLSLTKREVFLALYRAKQVTPEMIKAQMGENVEALIEFEYAEKYYRFNPLIDSIGGMFGYNSDDLDYLFINKEFPKKEEE